MTLPALKPRPDTAHSTSTTYPYTAHLNHQPTSPPPTYLSSLPLSPPHSLPHNTLPVKSPTSTRTYPPRHHLVLLPPSMPSHPPTHAPRALSRPLLLPSHPPGSSPPPRSQPHDINPTSPHCITVTIPPLHPPTCPRPTVLTHHPPSTQTKPPIPAHPSPASQAAAAPLG